ncbi:MAG TPA: hypothetical protein VKM55_20635 [Candidatus Lokiarchaeia archaeon]|nr:hypothetical protein [Candidatus Lokiarchaeia archaeon]
MLVVILVNLYSLLDKLNTDLSTNLNSVFFNFTIIVNFFNFLLFIIVIAIILALIANIIFMIYYIEKRLRDIAVMKAMGIAYIELLKYFSFPPAIASLSGFTIGSVVIFIGMNISFPALFSLSSYSLLFYIILLFGNFVVILIIPEYKLSTIYKKNVINVLDQEFNKDFMDLRKKSRFRNFLGRFSKTMLYSYKNLLTRKMDFRRTTTLFTLTCLVSGLLFTSGFVIQLTYQHDISQALGGDAWPDIVVVGHEDMVNFIVNSYKSFGMAGNKSIYEPAMISQSFYLNKSNFNSSMYSREILSMDWRIIYNTTANEIPGIQISPPPYNAYQTWGSNRKCSALVQGVNSSTIFNKFPEINSTSFHDNSIVLGDSVEGLIIDNSQYEKIGINGHNFPISGSMFDPMANGFTIYMSINQLRSILNETSEYYNCAFITLKKMTDLERNEFILNLSAYIKQVYGPDFTASSLKDTFGTVIDSINSFIWIHFLLAALIFIFAIFYQLEFVKTTIRNNFKDYAIMHATGISKRSIEKMIQQEFIMVLVISSILAFSLCLIMDGFFLIKQPTLPSIFVPIAIFAAISIILALVNRILIRFNLKF